MARYQVCAVWAVTHPKLPRGADLFAGAWPPGLRASLYDGTTLTVVADVSAPSPDDAGELVTGRAVLAWAAVGGGALGAPDSIRALPLSPPDRVSAGSEGGLRQAWRERSVAALRRASRGRGETLRGRPWPDAENLWPDTGPAGPDDGPPDDGGLAGVREPRRPKPGPGHLSAVADPPPGIA